MEPGTSSSWTGGAILSLDKGSPPGVSVARFPGRSSLCSRQCPILGPALGETSEALRRCARRTNNWAAPATHHVPRSRTGRSRRMGQHAATPIPIVAGRPGGPRHSARPFSLATTSPITRPEARTAVTANNDQIGARTSISVTPRAHNHSHHSLVTDAALGDEHLPRRPPPWPRGQRGAPAVGGSRQTTSPHPANHHSPPSGIQDRCFHRSPCRSTVGVSKQHPQPAIPRIRPHSPAPSGQPKDGESC